MTTTKTASVEHEIVNASEWLEASRQLLAKEKDLTRLSDDLARRRRELPWTPVEKPYQFDGPRGKAGLADLFDGKSQLAVYHFMLGPDWAEGCPSCSFLGDHFNGMIDHLRERDVNLAFVSSGPLEQLLAFERRMGWRIPWFSSSGCEFNRDFAVTFSKEELASGENLYNLDTRPPYSEENPGLTLFYQDGGGNVYRTYSTYARGLDILLGAYAILDRAPLGRNEESLPWPMAWVRHHDKYEQKLQLGAACCQKK